MPRKSVFVVYLALAAAPFPRAQPFVSSLGRRPSAASMKDSPRSVITRSCYRDLDVFVTHADANL